MLSARTAVWLVAALLLVALAFALGSRELSALWLGVGVHPRVPEMLEQAMSDQRTLAEQDPDNAARYRARYEELQDAVQSLRVLEQSRERITRRYQLLLGALLASLVAGTLVAQTLLARRNRRRLELLRRQLEQLSAGEEVERGSVAGRDLVGRIGSMVEETSRLVGSQRRRLAAARELGRWQEAARRQAHEIKGPLTATRLELERLSTLVHGGDGTSARIAESVTHVTEEVGRLTRWSAHFSEFARLPEPRCEPVDLQQLLRDFVRVFSGAWPTLTLVLEDGPRLPVSCDKELVRQILNNLADNSSRALGERSGRLTLTTWLDEGAAHVRLADDGPGVDASVQARLFEPYATTRRREEGGGLGLAIARKIALDHRGDLRLVESSAAGAVFEFWLPVVEE